MIKKYELIDIWSSLSNFVPEFYEGNKAGKNVGRWGIVATLSFILPIQYNTALHIRKLENLLQK